jgi:hypothetical protein
VHRTCTNGWRSSVTLHKEINIDNYNWARVTEMKWLQDV